MSKIGRINQFKNPNKTAKKINDSQVPIISKFPAKKGAEISLKYLLNPQKRIELRTTDRIIFL
jgi:hypothetical protein